MQVLSPGRIGIWRRKKTGKPRERREPTTNPHMAAGHLGER